MRFIFTPIPIGAIFTWIYYALQESSPKQATLGKTLMGIKVTDLQGNKISFRQASIRFWSKILSFFAILIGYIMAIYTKKKQTLHDKISKCLVIKSSSDNISNQRKTNTNWWSKNWEQSIFTSLLGGILGLVILAITYAYISLHRGNARYELGEYQAAIEHYNQAIRFNPNYAVAYSNRGNARYELREYQAAIEDFNQAIRLDPNDAVAYNNRGLAYSHQGEYQAAIENYTQAIRLNPNLALAYYNRGSVHLNLGKYQAAIEDLNQAIRLDPNAALAYHNRGAVHYKLGEYQAGIEDYNQAIRLDPNYALSYDNRGDAYKKIGNKQKAINDFQKAADLYQKQGYPEFYEETLNKIKEIQR